MPEDKPLLEQSEAAEIVNQLGPRHTNGYGQIKWDHLIRDLGDRYSHGGLTLEQMEAAIDVATERERS